MSEWYLLVLKRYFMDDLHILGLLLLFTLGCVLVANWLDSRD